MFSFDSHVITTPCCSHGRAHSMDDLDDWSGVSSGLPSEVSHSSMDDEGVPTDTSVDQRACEALCAQCYAAAAVPCDRASLFMAPAISLQRDRHIAYLMRGLGDLPASFISLDASRCWIVYWALHGLDLLGVRPVEEFPRIISFLGRCQCAGGGFGGGPGALAHTAATYAAVLALLIISTPESLETIDRPALLSFYRSLKDDASGGFRVQQNGEMDVRGSYTVLALCSLLGLLPSAPDLFSGTAEFLLACQSYEGGFGGEPGCEAHGGYTFCSIAGLVILGQLHRARLRDLSRWLVHRQTALEGGFQGRTNKLVDACYSFWQGACFLMLPPTAVMRRRVRSGLGSSASRSPASSDALDRPGSGAVLSPSSSAPPTLSTSAASLDIDDDGAAADVALVPDDVLMDRARLQRYTLWCSQDPAGGLRDKPGKSRDFYHSCYSLSGLSIAQQDRSGAVVPDFVMGPPGNALTPTHPVYNITRARVAAAQEYFATTAVL